MPTLTLNRLDRRDPTRTTYIRNAFAREMSRRFDKLCKEIRRMVVDEDGFGLKAKADADSAMRRLGVGDSKISVHTTFDFPTSPEKIAAFRLWLDEMVAKGILETYEVQQIGKALNENWTDTYIRQAYEQGVRRGREELIGAGFAVPPFAETTGAAGLQLGASLLINPFHADRVGILYVRAFEELKGITAEMSTQVSRILAQGIAEGDNPNILARKMVRTITGPYGDLGITDVIGRKIPARQRARMLARTEIIRAHHQATVQEYMNWEVEDVYVLAELVTAEDWRVCSVCKKLEAKTRKKPIKPSEAMNLIPVHPNCRCCTIPIDVTDKVRAERERRSE